MKWIEFDTNEENLMVTCEFVNKQLKRFDEKKITFNQFFANTGIWAFAVYLESAALLDEYTNATFSIALRLMTDQSALVRLAGLKY